MPNDCPGEINPFAQAEQIKNPQIFNLNYTNQDFYSMKTRLVDFCNQRFGPNGTVIPNTFNDWVEGSVAVMLMEAMAFLSDGVCFKIDYNANEPYIDTVTELENAFRIAKNVGMSPTPPIAARTLWTATLNSVLANDVTLPSGISVDVAASDRPITIEIFAADSNGQPLFGEDIVIPAGSLVNSSIVGLEGQTIEQESVGTGEVGQIVELGSFPVIYGSVTVEVDGILWTQVEYFTDSQPRREYRVEFNSDYQAFVIFGNNRAGLLPSNGSRILVTYRVGGGTVGNIVPGAVERQFQAIVFGLDFNVPVTLRNYTKGEFGYNGDGIEEIRRKLPAYLRTQNRAVTGTDYKTLTDQFVTPYNGQIGKSTAVLRQHGCAGNVIDLFILAKSDEDDLELAGNGLKVELNEMMDEVKMLTDVVCIRDGTIISVDVAIEAVADKFQRKFESELREQIQRRVDSFFSINNWDYGQDLKATNIIKELSDIRTIESFSIVLTTNDEDNSGDMVTAKYYEIIRPDTIDISFLFE